jgi:hypothetical protein
MMNKDSEKFTTRFQHYIVAYIDVLGQKAELAKLEKLLDNGERTGEPVLKAKRQTIDVVKKIRNDFLEFQKERMGSEFKNPWHRNLTAVQKDQFKKLKYGDIKFRYISDGIIIYAPLAMTQGEQRVLDILNIVSSTAFLILRSLAYNVAIRGAVELGWATKIDGWTKNKEDTDIYGPILVRAHYLEKKVAGYPRVIIGERLIDYLKLRSQLPNEEPGNPQEKLNKICEEHCRLLICEDTDGQFIVDFLGEYMQEIIKSPDVAPLAKLGYQFVEQEYIRHKQARNSKMAFRYEHLMNYYLERLPNMDSEAKKR